MDSASDTLSGIVAMPEPGKSSLSANLQFWMTRLPTALKSTPIIRLAIPGSHDTMTYTIHRYNDVGPDGPAIVRFLGRYFSLISKPIVYNWSVTQHDEIEQQLNGGIRYLDLRLATKPTDDNVYFVHGLYGSEVSQPLEQVADWLSAHPGEIVILDFQHFYAFQDAHHQMFIKKIQKVFQGKLCPVFPKFNHISLQWLAMEKYQVLAIYRNAAARNEAILWPGELWPNPWADTVDPDYLVNFLNKELIERQFDRGFVSQCLLTPDTPYVLKHICGTLQRDLSTLCERFILPWVKKKKPGSGGLNIAITDFVSHDNFAFCKTIVERNAELLKDEELRFSAKQIEVRSKGAI